MPPFSEAEEKWGHQSGSNGPGREAKAPNAPILGNKTPEDLEEHNPGRGGEADRADNNSLTSSAIGGGFKTLDYRRDPDTGKWVYDPGWYEPEIPRRGRDLP